MLRAALKPHPTSRYDAVSEITVVAGRTAAGELRLAYAVNGDVGSLRIPPRSAPVRTDGLWQHTCFEVFLRAPDSIPYCEYNLAPSTEWAAYRFSAYREGSVPLDVPAPRITVRADASLLMLEALMDVSTLALLPEKLPWQLAVSAVIEENSGRLSYWALAHAGSKPDFHQPDCFTLRLPPACPA